MIMSMKGKIKESLHSKAAGFARFAYNRETGEIFGRTCKSWGKLRGPAAVIGGRGQTQRGKHNAE